MLPRRDIPVVVTDHAKERLRERFPGVKPARIFDEVRLAIAEGRLSPRPPRHFRVAVGDDATFAWTPDEARAYVLTVRPQHDRHGYLSRDTWVVVSVIEPAGEWAA